MFFAFQGAFQVAVAIPVWIRPNHVLLATSLGDEGGRRGQVWMRRDVGVDASLPVSRRSKTGHRNGVTKGVQKDVTKRQTDKKRTIKKLRQLR